MPIPFFGNKQQIVNPRAKRAQQNQVPADIYDPRQTVVPQPTGEPPVAPAAAPAPAAPAAPAPQQPPQSSDELEQAIARLSFTGMTYKNYGTAVLYSMDGSDKEPISFMKVIERWRAVPEKLRFDPLDYEHYVYCYDPMSGAVATDVIPPDGFCSDAIKEHDEGVQDIMAKLTGKKPAAAPGAITAAALLTLSKDQWKQLFSEMDAKQVRQILNPGHDRLTELKAQEKAQQQPPKSGEPTPQPAPKPQPVPALKPAAQPAGRNGKKAWPTNIGKDK